MKSYKHKIYTTLGTPTSIDGEMTSVSAGDSSGVPVKDYTIKGKSIVWNQLVKNGNFQDYSAWEQDNGSYIVDNNRAQFTSGGSESSASIYQYIDKSKFFEEHYYYACVNVSASNYVNIPIAFALHNGDNTQQTIKSISPGAAEWDTLEEIFTLETDFVNSITDQARIVIYAPESYASDGYITYISNVMLIDLTKIFGAGYEPQTIEEFRVIFPEDYYEYDEGTLKSVEPKQLQSGSVERYQMADFGTLYGSGSNVDFLRNFPSGTKIIKGHTYCLMADIVEDDHTMSDLAIYYNRNNSNNVFVRIKPYTGSKQIAVAPYTLTIWLYGYSIKSATNIMFIDLTELFGYGNEPQTIEEFQGVFPDSYYKSNPSAYKAVNVPSSKYFPTGMKSIGETYDEINLLSQTAIQRIGVRSYQNGDENNVEFLTDEKNTLYVLSTPVTTAISPELQSLPTYKEFNSFSAPNTLTQTGPFSIEYYSTSSSNPEKGWLTSYKRKILTNVSDLQNVEKRDTLYPIKGQFTVTRDSEDLTWDVLDYDKHELVDADTDKTMCVGMHNIFIYGTMPFCAPQLMYWSENGLPAGTYKLTLDHAQYGGGTVYDGTYMFTLTKAIPADGGFRHTKPVGGWRSSYAKADILGNYITTYGARPQRSAIESGVTFSEYDGTTECTDLGTFTARSRTYYTEDDTANGGKRNFTERQAYGSNRWRDSVYRQWLNSTAPAGTTGNGVSNWWTPQSVFDRAPGGANSAGFLYGLDPSFVAAMGKVKVITALCDCDKVDGATQDITYDKVWLQSMTEIFGNTNNSISEGVRLAYWNGSTDADRIKYHNGTARYWRLRSPDPTCALSVLSVISSGVLRDNEAGAALGVVPACCIKQYNGASRLLTSYKSIWGDKHYGVRWNKVDAQMERLYDAASFPTDITNFAHRGSVNANYSNPFDSIYPWAGIKLCNISIDLYRNLAAGDSITKCVTAWEGDANFSYNDMNGVWRYRPEFWGKSWEDDTYRYFDVSEKAIGSYVHYPEAIVGRWHGRAVSMTIGGEEKGCLIPSVGMPAKSISMIGLHTRAKNFGATLDSIFSVDADTLLCIVEFATMNTQNAIGNGVSNLYRQSSDLIQEDATNSTTVKVLAAAGSAYCIPGAIFDIGTSNGGTQVGSFVVVSATPNVGDAQYLDVTLDQAVTVTGANYWSVHGLVNVADEAIGSKSGYIGANGKCNAYYRGIVMYGNVWFYILGAYENKDDHHIWIANSDAEADNYDALDTTVHYDTGLVLPTAGGYTKKLGLLSRSGLLSIPVFCVETGGDSSNPVGDYFYNGSYTYRTVLLRGGNASDGSRDGAFCCNWNDAASNGNWGISARPRLKNP